ncbi:phytanoyl-CoA dioxygenase family protein [Acuticoccus mangrovi]|uniref:Phytanoyl-CoA dioxygenase family protein n=1 Tax=Acuticoccus mangrovi TaxID=2796142 RepID=A0A934MIB1_9HYPH|nr:phytanoyl-CoA dioxygenase family protein [Acuticoccus mangrovi]MBJ3778573.1 phytanoyl-CoA dioxygenase family protein [Acuticoccus mangrovi]
MATPRPTEREVLSADDVAFYDDNGYVVLERRLPAETVAALKAELARFREMARGLRESDERLDLEDSHSPDDPRVRRVKLPHTQSDIVAELMRSDLILAPVRDLVGPDVRLHTSKLNVKSAHYGAPVDWHQDFAFYPHTNDDLLAVGVMLDDVDEENGPLMVFPGSHKGPIYDHHASGVFAGTMDLEASGFDMKDAVKLMAPAGSISIHHGRIVHGSDTNRSARDRGVIFYEMMAADAFPIMGSMTGALSFEEYDTRMLCGSPTKAPRLEAIPVRVPQPQPVKRGSIYEVQKAAAKHGFRAAAE